LAGFFDFAAAGESGSETLQLRFLGLRAGVMTVPWYGKVDGNGEQRKLRKERKGTADDGWEIADVR